MSATRFTPLRDATGCWYAESTEALIAVGKRPDLALLFAAASELLAACEAVVAPDGDLEPEALLAIVRQVKAAIAKAKGETP